MADRRTYRIFAQDVGRNGYSGVEDVTARTPADAASRARAGGCWGKLIAIAHAKRNLWPDSGTGLLPNPERVLGAAD